MSYGALRGCWVGTLVLSVRPTAQDKSVDKKDSCCKEIQQIFTPFLNYQTNTFVTRF